MAQLVKTPTGNVLYKSMKDQAKTLEYWRKLSGKKLKEWCDFIGTTNPTYQQILAGRTYPNTKILAVLLFRGYDLLTLFFHKEDC